MWHVWGDKCIQGLVGKPERKKPLGRSWRRWEDNINCILKKLIWGWTGLVRLMIGTTGELL
jgi:hypothetical protein